MSDRKNDFSTPAPQPAKKDVRALVDEVGADELRAFLRKQFADDESLQRRFEAQFGIADVKEAIKALKRATTDIKGAYERSGFIEWRESSDFEYEYLGEVHAIVDPFLDGCDADALTSLAIALYVQIQRISIDDSNGFFTEALAVCNELLERAYELGDTSQRRKLFKELQKFMEKNPGSDRGDIYWYEKDGAEGFIRRRYPTDPAFAADIRELARTKIAALSPEIRYGYDSNSHERSQWELALLQASKTLGATYDELAKLANGTALYAEAVDLLASACLAERGAEEAVRLLRDNIDATPLGGRWTYKSTVPRPVDRLVELVGAQGEKELAALYVELLSAPPKYADDADAVRWYGAVRKLVGEDGWQKARGDLIAAMPYRQAQACLADEGSYEELMENIKAHGGDGLYAYERVLAPLYPEPYIERYAEQAEFEFDRAYNRKMYKQAAKLLQHVAQLAGGGVRAQELAMQIKEKYPRKPALLEEIARLGF